MINWTKIEDGLPEPDMESPFGNDKVTQVLTWGLYIRAEIPVLYYEKRGFSTNYFHDLFEDDEEKADIMLEAWKKNITHWTYINKPEEQG